MKKILFLFLSLLTINIFAYNKQCINLELPEKCPENSICFDDQSDSDNLFIYWFGSPFGLTPLCPVVTIPKARGKMAQAFRIMDPHTSPVLSSKWVIHPYSEKTFKIESPDFASSELRVYPKN